MSELFYQHVNLHSMAIDFTIPPELDVVKTAAMRALGPVKPTGPDTLADGNFIFGAERTNAGHSLPPYYLVYFLLVDLLGFKDLGQYEKVSWSVPIDYLGVAFLIEHRKFGIGVFAQGLEQEDAVRQIVIRIQKAVKAARPYFDWLAARAVQNSKINVINNSSALFDRFKYFLDAYRIKSVEATSRKDECVVNGGKRPDGNEWHSYSHPAVHLKREGSWLAMATIEAFFSWTEHVFIHFAILCGRLRTAEDVTAVAEYDWSSKFKLALDLSDSKAKDFFDKLVSLRKEIRNYVAHGTFGKKGEAFSFHSRVGAVPVLLPHRAGSMKFKLGEGLKFDSDAALNVIEEFTCFLWAGSRAPAEIYIYSGLPIILTMGADGTYLNAMKSSKSMTDFVDYLSRISDDAANMDW